jgi:hypothetical protein
MSEDFNRAKAHFLVTTLLKPQTCSSSYNRKDAFGSEEEK